MKFKAFAGRAVGESGRFWAGLYRGEAGNHIDLITTTVYDRGTVKTRKQGILSTSLYRWVFHAMEAPEHLNFLSPTPRNNMADVLNSEMGHNHL